MNLEIGIQIKITYIRPCSYTPSELRGEMDFSLLARRRILVTCDPNPRLFENKIEILLWKVFLEDLWAGKIIR